MNILEAAIHTPLAKTLGWALVHFLWEGALIALVLGTLLFLCGPGPARLRYALCCLAMALMPVAFGVTVALTQPAPLPAPVILLPVPAPPGPGGGTASAPWTKPLAERLREALPWVVPFWMAGVLLLYVRSLGSWMAAQRLRRVGVCAAPNVWQDRLAGLCRRLHLRTPVALLESCLIDVPVVIGFVRPAILMPVGLLMGLATDQMESILIHELAHIRRRDYLVNLLQSFVEGLLFYHPAVWWISGLARAERENCCDDVVLQLKGDARAYAAALATLENSRWPAREPALAATGGNLMKRIHRLLQGADRPRTAAAPIFVTGLLIVSLGVAVGGWQTKAPQITEAPQSRKPAPALVAQAEAQRKQPSDSQPDSPYRKWMTEDVAYIITNAERAAFKSLTTDPEREHFIEQFWLRRDPTPGTPENEMKEEHYRRIAYVNEHFASTLPGWKTDRGRIYISYGPPDEMESHKSGGAYERPPEQGGGTTSTFPFEQWMYRYLDGIGQNIIIEFVDPTYTGEYRMTMDPSEKDALRFVKPPVVAGPVGRGGATVQAMGKGAALISIPLASYGNHKVDLNCRILTMTRGPVDSFQTTIQGPAPAYTKFIGLPAGAYRLVVTVTVKDATNDATDGATVADETVFEVK